MQKKPQSLPSPFHGWFFCMWIKSELSSNWLFTGLEKKSPNGLDIKSPLRYLKCLFGVACWKCWAFSFLQDGRVKPVTVAEWAKPARAAVRWDYGTTVDEGTATQGRGEQISHQWLPDGIQAQVLFLHIQIQFGWLVLHKGLKLGFFIMRLTGVLCGKLDNINLNMLTVALNAL